MLKQLEELTLLIRALTYEANGNMPQDTVPFYLLKNGYAYRKNGTIVVRREKLVADITTGVFRGTLGVGRGTYVSVILWLLQNPA